MTDATILAARVRELFSYDPLTGVFIRKVRLAQRHKVGDRADFLVTVGNLKGYRRISFDSKRYLAHRIAWLYTYGVWPLEQIDHKNGVKSENWLLNLRQADYQSNAENQRGPRSHNLSGYLGVSSHESGRFVARIQVERKGIYLGIFDSPEDAHAAYLRAKRQLHAGCTL